MLSSEKPHITREIRLHADRFRVDRASYQNQDGRVVTRDVIEHPGAVVVLPILRDGRICLIRNFRIAVGDWLLELPAGTLEKDEPPIQTASRELVEETGYHAGKIEPLCEFFMSPGILHEHMFAFLATDLKPGEPNREFGEWIDNHLVTPDELDSLLQSGGIRDSKTISAILFYLRYRGELDS